MKNGLTIRQGATCDMVTVTYDGHTTGIPLDKVTRYNKSNFLSDLIVWALNGYKGFPPSLKR